MKDDGTFSTKSRVESAWRGVNWKGSRLLTAMLVTLSAALTIAAFPDLDFEILAWVALVPWLARLPDLSPKAAFGWSFVWGVMFFSGLLYWLFPVKMPETAVAAALLVLFCSLFPALCLWGVRKFLSADSLEGYLWAPFFWTAFEFFNASVPVASFPWCLLGNSQYRNLPLLQICSVTGVYGLSFLLVAVNACLAYCCRRRLAGGGGDARVAKGLSLALCLALLVAYAWGRSRVGRAAGGQTIKAVLLQGNYDHLHKWNPKSLDEIMQTYDGLCAEAGRESADLVIWPETAIPTAILDYPEVSRKIERIVQKASSYSLVGALKTPPDSSPEEDSDFHYNTAFLFGPDGKRLPQEYYKRHLVPFGEYVPFQNLLFFVDIVSAGAGLFLPGDQATLFEVPLRSGGTLHFGVLTCFESIFPQMAREYAVKGADLLVVITNDAWYGKTAMPYQLAAMAAIRAVENGLPLLRSANTGLTLWVDGRGTIQEVFEHGGEALFVEGKLVAEPRLERLDTFYSRWGDLFSYACVLVALAVIGRALTPRRLGPETST